MDNRYVTSLSIFMLLTPMDPQKSKCESLRMTRNLGHVIELRVNVASVVFWKMKVLCHLILVTYGIVATLSESIGCVSS